MLQFHYRTPEQSKKKTQMNKKSYFVMNRHLARNI